MLRDRYFRKDGDHWVAHEKLRAMIRFQRYNLLTMWPVAEQQDLILLRNVLIYFDDQTRIHILERMSRLLKPDGLLMLGSAESPPIGVQGLTRELHGHVACYRRQTAASAA